MSAFHTGGVTGSGAGRALVVSLDPLRMCARRHHAHALQEHIWRDGAGMADLSIELCMATDANRAQRSHSPLRRTSKTIVHTRPSSARGHRKALWLTSAGTFRIRFARIRYSSKSMLFFLPDTRAISYHREHAKTTIGIDVIDPEARRLGYFHHTDYHLLDGDDYDGVLKPHAAHDGSDGRALYPHVEFVKHVRDPLTGTLLAEVSADPLCAHLLRRPLHSPVSCWRAAFPEHVDTMLARSEAYARLYALNVMRQLGMNFKLLAHYLHWMRKQGFDIPVQTHTSARKIANEMMVMQCRLARTLSRRRHELCESSFDVMEEAYERVVPPLADIVV